MLSKRNVGLLAAPLVLTLAAGCSGDSNSNVGAQQGTGADQTGMSPTGDLGGGVFESINLTGGVDENGNSRASLGGVTSGPDAMGSAGSAETVADVATSNGAMGSLDPNGAEPPVEDTTSAARAIEEADIIKISGNRLYALSAYGGLSVVDISNPDALKLLGRHRTTATPFEMYVRGDNVFVLYNGYGEYTYDDASDYWTFYQTSYVISLDTADPKNITEAQKFEINGYIADSRLVGDVMYVAAYDDSYCYRCGSTQETNVLSLNVTNPANIVKADELTFAERDSSYSWRRSLSATDERLYIAGPRYGNGNDPDGSLIQVVDITDTAGDMVEGDKVEVAGQINSRWQMDEYEGVLRVISQPLQWISQAEPEVQTYSIVSSADLQLLGSTPITLPRAEQLQSVRFDGPRGYAITFQQTDPLFTIDLSDPANPVQVGELEMPGWVYYMEPRGDRVIGLGYDQGNPEGAITVSIFDVSDLATPTMLDRVNFGGDWGNLAEDQDRIHKSFQVLDDKKLILVPFSGYTYGDYNSETCKQDSGYLSGVQLIDWDDDALALGGVAKGLGQARRAFFVGERLLTMSDERVEAFDVSDHATPTSTSFVDLAQVVNQLAAAGDTVVRIGNIWYGDTLAATVSSLDELKSFAPGVQVELPGINSYDCNSQSYLNDVMSSDDKVYFLYTYYDYNAGTKEEYKVRTLDVSDPGAPKVVGDAALGLTPSYSRNYIPGMVDNGKPSVGINDALVFAQHDTEYNNLGFITKNGYTLDVIDFADPANPNHTSVKLPDSLGSTGLLTSGNVVASSHFETSASNPNNVRFYLDRLDVSNASNPQLLPTVNIPGSLLAYDHAASRALTVDYLYETIADISPRQCYEVEFGQFLTSDPSLVDYETGRGTCSALRFKLYLLDIADGIAKAIDTVDVDKGVQITAVAVGDDRVFLGTGAASGYYGGGVAISEPAPATSGGVAVGGGGLGFYYYYYNFQTVPAKLLVASGLKDGKLVVSSAELEATSNFYGFNQLLAHGTKAVVATGWEGRLSVVDATDAAAPTVSDSSEIGGYVSDLDMVGDVAVAALGQAGVQTINLGK